MYRASGLSEKKLKTNTQDEGLLLFMLIDAVIMKEVSKLSIEYFTLFKSHSCACQWECFPTTKGFGFSLNRVEKKGDLCFENH